MEQTDTTPETPQDEVRSGKKTPIEQRRARRWRSYMIAFSIVWVVANLFLQPGSVEYHLTSSRWIIATVLGGLIGCILFGYVVKTLYAMQRGAKHRRILRQRATWQATEATETKISEQ